MDREKLEAAGIDYEGGLGRFVGNTGLYQKYLLKFPDDTHAAEAMAAYAAGDLKTVLERVHALKGLAGTLGFSALYEVCAEIVKRLRQEENPDLEAKMQVMERECKKMVNAIRDE